MLLSPQSKLGDNCTHLLLSHHRTHAVQCGGRCEVCTIKHQCFMRLFLTVSTHLSQVVVQQEASSTNNNSNTTDSGPLQGTGPDTGLQDTQIHTICMLLAAIDRARTYDQSLGRMPARTFAPSRAALSSACSRTVLHQTGQAERPAPSCIMVNT